MLHINSIDSWWTRVLANGFVVWSFQGALAGSSYTSYIHLYTSVVYVCIVYCIISLCGFAGRDPQTYWSTFGSPWNSQCHSQCHSWSWTQRSQRLLYWACTWCRMAHWFPQLDCWVVPKDIVYFSWIWSYSYLLCHWIIYILYIYLCFLVCR